jgi:low temperature requirement protein LtrA
VLAVFTADAVDGSGRAFAIVYATFLAVVTWLFFTVRRQERRDRPEFVAETGRYVTEMAVAVVVIVASALLPAGPRLIVWAGVAIAWIVGMLLAGRARVGLQRGCLPPSRWWSDSAVHDHRSRRSRVRGRRRSVLCGTQR